MRRSAWAALLVLCAVSTGCGPDGPGALTGRVTGDDLGAVLLEVEGVGIQSFEASGSTQLYAASVAGQADTHRVILLSAQAGLLEYRINVDDVGMDPPVVTVLQAALTTNQAVSAAVATATIER